MNIVKQFIRNMQTEGVYFFTEKGKLKSHSKDYKFTNEDVKFIKKHKQEIILEIYNNKANISPTEEQSARSIASYQQERLWLTDQISASGKEYNSVAIFKLEGSLDIEALNESFISSVERHDVLKSIYSVVDGQVYQEKLKEVSPKLLIHVSYNDAIEKEAKSLANLESDYAFKLDEEIPIRGVLLTNKERTHYLILNTHHIAWDGWSIGIFMRDLGEIYNAKLNNRARKLKTLNIQYSDYSKWQRNQISGDVLKALLFQWSEYLKNAPAVHSLPYDFSEVKKDSTQCGAISYKFPEALSKKFRKWCHNSGATPFIGFHTLLSILWYKMSGENDIVVGSPIANREHPDIEPMVGFFVNMLPIRSQIEAEDSLNDLFEKTKKSIEMCIRYQQAPFEKIVETIAPERQRYQNPLFQTVLAFQNNAMPDPYMEGITASLLMEDQIHGRFDIEIHVFDEEQFTLEWIYSTALFSNETMKMWMTYLEQIMDTMVHNSTCKVKDVELGSPKCLPDLTNKQDVPDLMNCILDLDKNQRGIVYEDDQCRHSYQNMIERATQIAYGIRSVKRTNACVIGINYEPSYNAICALVGVLLSGNAYTFIDSKLPDSRLASMLSIASVELILTPEKLENSICAESVKQLSLEEIQRGSECVELPIVDGDQLAYIMFTSGTTGMPKGVKISRRNLSSYVYAFMKKYQVEHPLRFSWHSNMLTDFVNTTVYVALCSGGTLVKPENEHVKLDKHLFSKFMKSQAIDFLKITPSHYRALIEDTDVNDFLPAKMLVFGGEKLESSLLKQIKPQASLRHIHVVNHYGPTEVTVGCMSQNISNHNLKYPVTIGQPFENHVCFIIGNDGNLAPVGAFGELHISGPQVSCGYLNANEKDKAKFKSITHDSKEYFVYNTGDLVRVNALGAYEIAGRKDKQVKVRGFRVELGEIEVQAKMLTGITEVKALIDGNGTHNELLLFYTADASGADQDQSADENFVELWKEFYDYNYSGNEKSSTFNISGWLSSYTGNQIPECEMRSWFNDIMQVIMSSKPQRILEIGCGYGIFSFEFAKSCSQYIGIDFSESIIHQNRQITQASSFENLKFYCDEAGNIDKYIEEIINEQIEVVVINSVVQYFPSFDYLTNIISELLKVESIKEIIIGDVRDYNYAQAFHLSLELYELERDKKQIGEEDLFIANEKAKQKVFDENELLIAPHQFIAYKKTFDLIQEVETIPRVSAYSNELVRFRYDVKLVIKRDIGSKAISSQKPIYPIDFNTYMGKSAEYISEQLAAVYVEKDVVPVLECIPILKEFWICDALNTHQFSHALHDVEDTTEWSGNVLYDLKQNLKRKGLEIELRHDLSNPKYVYLGVVASEQDYTSFNDFVQTHQNHAMQVVSIKGVNNPAGQLNASKADFTEKINERLTQTLPEHMIPKKIIKVREFPLNSTGKLDEKKLLTYAHKQNKGEAFKPVGELEEKIAKIYSEVIAHDVVIDRFSSFFELGGNSLLATKLSHTLKQVLQADVSVGDIFENASVFDLAELITQRSIKIDLLSPSKIENRAIKTPALASHAQERLWILEQLSEDTTPYNIGHVFKISGEINTAALQEAVTMLAERHEILRTTFFFENTSVYQEIHEDNKITFKVISQVAQISAYSVDEVIQSYFNKPFDLETSCGRVVLVQNNVEKTAYILFAFHHIIFDGSSESVFFSELSQLYSDIISEKETVRPSLPIQFADFAQWQRSKTQSEKMSVSYAYWANQLKEIPECHSLVLDKMRPAFPENSGAYVQQTFSPKVTRHLNQISNRENISLFMTLHALLVKTIYEISGEQDVCIGTPMAGRHIAELDALIGFFVNTVVLRTDFGACESYQELFKRIRKVDLEAYEHQDVPFDYLVKEYAPNRSMQYTPLFQIMLVLQNTEGTDFSLEGLDIEPQTLWYNTSKFDLTLNCKEIEGVLHVIWEYSDEIFNKTTIEGFTRVFNSQINQCLNAYSIEDAYVSEMKEIVG